MSVFDAIRRAVLRADGTQISEAFSSTNQTAVEMTDLANECAAEIVASHDWRALTKINTITGGLGETYPLPADYSRMTGGIEDPASWFWGYEPFHDVNEYLRFKTGGFSLVGNGGWIILDGALNFYPAPAGGSAFTYVSNLYARSEAGEPKAEFTQGNDTFVLSDRLLTLALLWRWKAQKGLEYGEDMANYETDLAREASRDRGYFTLRAPTNRLSGAIAYSGRAIR
jgi:hypothetical protein